jgi:hypothetical protein
MSRILYLAIAAAVFALPGSGAGATAREHPVMPEFKPVRSVAPGRVGSIRAPLR